MVFPLLERQMMLVPGGWLTGGGQTPHAGWLQLEGHCTPGRSGECAELVSVVSMSKCSWGEQAAAQNPAMLAAVLCGGTAPSKMSVAGVL